MTPAQTEATKRCVVQLIEWVLPCVKRGEVIATPEGFWVVKRLPSGAGLVS